jgi:hypothetical protein
MGDLRRKTQRTRGGVLFDLLQYHTSESERRRAAFNFLDDLELEGAYFQAAELGVRIGSAVLAAADMSISLEETGRDIDDHDRAAFIVNASELVAVIRERCADWLGELADRALIAHPGLVDPRMVNAMGHDLGTRTPESPMLPDEVVPRQHFPV